MTTPIANIDSTTLNSLTPNLDIGDVADPALRKAAFQYIYTEMQTIITAYNAFVGAGGIATGNLADLSVTTAKLADLAVTTGKIPDLAIVTAKINDLAVTAAKIAVGTITSAQIADLGIATGDLADALITTAKLADLNVTTGKLADASVTLAKMAAASVGTTQLVDLSVTTSKIALASVGVAQLSPGATVNESVNNALIVALSAEKATLNINLAHYADFSSLAENYDITTIIQSAMADLATKVVGTSGWVLFKVSIFIPGGHWKVTTKRVFDLSTYSISSVRGFNIYGAGCENTQITFDSNIADADNYLIYNNDAYGYSEINGIRFVSAHGVEKCVYVATTGAGNAQSLIFRDVTFYGFQTGIYYTGASMTSEMDYYSCKFIATPSGGYGIYINNINSVNHNFYACDFETITGHGIHVVAGGCINFYGGSLIPATGGVILVTTDTTGTGTGTGNNVFNFYGVRSEMNGTGKLFDVSNNVLLNFNDCNLTVEISGAGNVRGTLGPISTYVTFNKCSNKYKYEYRYDNTIYSNGACAVHFENCTLFAELVNIISVTGSGANIAGLALLTTKNCRINYTGTAQRTVVDISLNKESTNLARALTSHTVFLRSGNDGASGLPANAGSILLLPLNSIIKKIRIVHLANASFGGTYAYDVKDYTGTTTFVSLGATAQNVEATAISADLWYRVDTVAKQSISVVQTGTNSTQTGYIVVEYI